MTTNPQLPAFTGSNWLSGRAGDYIHADRMALLVRRTIDGDARGLRYLWADPRTGDTGDTGWRYDYDPNHSPTHEAVHLTTRLHPDVEATTVTYTRPKNGTGR